MRERYTYHDSAPPRQQPLICTGAEPIQPVHSPPKLRATRVDAPKMGFHFRQFFAVFIYIGGVCQGNEDHSVSLSMSCRWATISPSASAMCVSAACCACVSGICESIITLVSSHLYPHSTVHVAEHPSPGVVSPSRSSQKTCCIWPC